MNVVYRYRDGVFECPLYAKRGERLSVKEYDGEWGCRIGKAFMLADSPKEAIEASLRFLGDTPIDADNQKAISTDESAPKPELSDNERTASMARIEAMQQSLANPSISRDKMESIMRDIEKERRKL